MTWRGVIFDLDGVIVHTDELHYLAWKTIADKIGVPFDREVNNLLRGVSREESLNIILRNAPDGFSQTEKEMLTEEKNELYRAYLGKLVPDDVEESVLTTLRELKGKGYRLAIGSSSKNAELILRQTGLLDFFDAISDGNNITRSKPAPDVFLAAAKFLMLTPNECVVVEDARAGIDAAVAGGFAGIGMGDAASYDKSTLTIGSFSELSRYL